MQRIGFAASAASAANAANANADAFSAVSAVSAAADPTTIAATFGPCPPSTAPCRGPPDTAPGKSHDGATVIDDGCHNRRRIAGLVPWSGS